MGWDPARRVVSNDAMSIDVSTGKERSEKDNEL